jgi:hypothetical protein
MLSSTTQETLLSDDIPPSHRTLLRSISALDTNDFNHFIQEHYGACWGTFKFEDSLSDYSNDVRINKKKLPGTGTYLT